MSRLNSHRHDRPRFRAARQWDVAWHDDGPAIVLETDDGAWHRIPLDLPHALALAHRLLGLARNLNHITNP